ncbi:oligomeric Golgi complex subunit 6 [Metschnikowia bicuspidata var. bicuspidata NRRL YB-4993]|uniref:Conserved oligomeric Golgi complex subunit 6 n=1 Tax=Metschnikowia bicuspidata var. bicuspidata NRRL YB-4993 TaxID=869754 RepID=A0A1A0HGB4_9ASCO|nr:oligomeric Golgi complex subunit 6 [Metschnikowia bicuspidata var. bicuspidata NRRL YB-4993]OBA22898.1 oligomeric Golgi complex subunit 6 [Metschnikowia bicuspidata var. bicuspidata NRRL YB-4993]
MDFVAFETFSENDVLPSPQPSLSLPLKSNINHLSAKLHNLKDFKSFLKQNHTQEPEEVNQDSKMAEQYAKLSLQMIDREYKDSQLMKSDEVSSSGLRADAFSLRLGRALNFSIGDTRIRELFTTLEPKILDNFQLINSGIEGSLARKNLRGEVEADVIKINASQLADYAKPIANLRYLGDRLQALDILVKDTNKLLFQNSVAVEDLRSAVSQYTDDKASVTLKRALLVTFRQKFTLNEYEEFLLSSTEINSDFFEALERAETINEACALLLALDNPELGKTIMTKISTLVNKAKHTIVSFCKKSLSNTDLLYSQEKLSVLKLCLQQLKQKPEQLVMILDTFVESRSSALLDDFNSQVGNFDEKENSMAPDDSRPVYYSSHDPLRFITDLLAYVHSSAANEAEIILGLFQSEDSLSSTRDEVVNKVMTSLANPVKSKIEQIITLEGKLSVLYQILNVLELYVIMFSKDLHARVISISIEDCINRIREKFKMILTSRLASVQESNLAKLELSSDLQPPEWIIVYYSDLLPIVDSMQSSTILGVHQEEHKQFLDLITERPIKIFQNHLNLVSNKFSKREKLIFQLNFLDLVVCKIIPLSLLGDRMLEINHCINDLSEEIIEEQFHTLLSECGLTDYYNVMNMIYPTSEDVADASIYLSVSESVIFKADLISEIDDKIQATIPTALLDIQLNLMKLNNPVIVNEIIEACSRRFLKFHKLFTEVVLIFISNSPFQWSASEIATLLGVDINHTIEQKL